MTVEVPIRLADYESEPCPVLDGPLCLGYREHIAGRPGLCRAVVSSFLASVYARPSRCREISTERYVREICRERGLAMPKEKSAADPAIVLEAAGRRYDELHLPVLKSILDRGYDPSLGPPITVIARAGRYLVRDGKNRASILAALGRETIPNAEVR